jgi:hypothetical protein
MRGCKRLWFVFAVVAAAVGLAVPAASAGLLLPSCGATSTPFARWNDSGSYCAFPNLGFESGMSGWTLTGKTSLAPANEPWQVSGPGGQSLRLGPGATALSAPLPINLLDPWIRFFAHNANANGDLRVQVIFHGLLGNLTGLLNFGSLSAGAYPKWKPTPRILSALALPLGTSTAQVLLTSTASVGNWQVDDLYLDPRIAKLG